MSRTLLLLALLLWTVDRGPATAAEPQSLTVFVFAGQSNMLGKRSKARDLPAEYQGVQANVLIFTGKRWEPYRPGLGQSAGFGPEVSAAYELANTLGEPVGIVKHSVGGTNLAKQWHPANGKNLYTTLENKVSAAGRARPIHVVGAFWAQGGADARSEEMGAAYSKNLDALIGAMRRDFKNSSLQFVAGLTGAKNAPFIPRYPALATVRAAQMKERKHYATIDCSEITTVSDRVHYDTRGIADLGRRMAAAMKTLLGASKAN